MAVSGTIAVGAGIGAGVYQGNKAASAQRAAAANANNQLRSSRRDALSRLDPYSDYGQQAMIPLSELIYGQSYDPQTGKFTPISEEQRMSSFKESPGYQFRLDQGLKAIERRNAATGTLLGGNTQKELSDYGQNTASDEYGNYLDQLMGQLQVGQTADTNAANVISGTGSQMANYQYAGGMANAQKYSNLSNALFGMAGMGASAIGSNVAKGGGGGNSGNYNSSFFSNAGNSSMGSSTNLTSIY